jgi:hypothetical protein
MGAPGAGNGVDWIGPERMPPLRAGMSSGIAPVGARSTSRDAVWKGLVKGSDKRVASVAHPPRRATAAPAKAIFTAPR